jgi:hypothetical protein
VLSKATPMMFPLPVKPPIIAACNGFLREIY